MLTAEQAKQIWRYDPETGHFFWLISPSRKIVIGRIAGHKIDGRWRLFFDGKGYKAHRIAWLLMTGHWPKNEIDHINRNPLDNRWCNLREATHQQNLRNSDRPRGKTGVKGVIYRSDMDKYCSRIRADGKRIHLGSFSTLEEARAAYMEAAVKYHGEFVNLGGSNASIS